MRPIATAAFLALLSGPSWAQTCFNVSPSVLIPSNDPDVNALIALAGRKHFDTIPAAVVQCADSTKFWWLMRFNSVHAAKPPAELTLIPSEGIVHLGFKKNNRIMVLYTPTVSWRMRLDADGNVIGTWMYDFNGRLIRQVVL